MDLLNSSLTSIAQWVLGPWENHPLLLLIVISVLAGILISFVFKLVSNQQALGKVLDRARGNTLAIKLFKDDLVGMFAAVANVITLMALRIWYSLFPVIVLTIPVLMLLAQCYLRYEHRPHGLDEPIIAELNVKPDKWSQTEEILLLPGEYEIETPVVRDPVACTMSWRVSAKQTGKVDLKWKIDDQEFTKSIIASDSHEKLVSINSVRPSGFTWQHAWYVGEDAIDDASPIHSVNIQYPKRDLPVIGFNIPWWATFFVVSIATSFLIQPLLGVRF